MTLTTRGRSTQIPRDAYRGAVCRRRDPRPQIAEGTRRHGPVIRDLAGRRYAHALTPRWRTVTLIALPTHRHAVIRSSLPRCFGFASVRGAKACAEKRSG